MHKHYRAESVCVFSVEKWKSATTLLLSVCVGNFSVEFDDFLGCVLCYCLPSFCILSTAVAAAAEMRS